jgi:dTDP-4-dehydrorhamnose 3,5-epimerase-like enzyme
VQWNDPDLKINWPFEDLYSPILSKKDMGAKPLRQLMDVLPWFEEERAS